MRIEIGLDDGGLSDLRAASLLKAYGLKGTFYLPNNTPLDMKDIRQKIVLEGGHEIGGHTVSHPMDMKLLNDDQLKFEIANNKKFCQQLTKYKLNKFCYPRGRHDQRVRQAVKDAGYKEARTTRVLQIKNDTGDPFQTPTTIHMFQRTEYEGVHWLEVAKVYLDKAFLTPDSFFSLWGHCFELDRDGEWTNFEEMLKLLSPIATNGASNI